MDQLYENIDCVQDFPSPTDADAPGLITLDEVGEGCSVFQTGDGRFKTLDDVGNWDMPQTGDECYKTLSEMRSSPFSQAKQGLAEFSSEMVTIDQISDSDSLEDRNLTAESQAFEHNTQEGTVVSDKPSITSSSSTIGDGRTTLHSMEESEMITIDQLHDDNNSCEGKATPNSPGTGNECISTIIATAKMGSKFASDSPNKHNSATKNDMQSITATSGTVANEMANSERLNPLTAPGRIHSALDSVTNQEVGAACKPQPSATNGDGVIEIVTLKPSLDRDTDAVIEVVTLKSPSSLDYDNSNRPTSVEAAKDFTHENKSSVASVAIKSSPMNLEEQANTTISDTAIPGDVTSATNMSGSTDDVTNGTVPQIGLRSSPGRLWSISRLVHNFNLINFN